MGKTENRFALRSVRSGNIFLISLWKTEIIKRLLHLTTLLTYRRFKCNACARVRVCMCLCEPFSETTGVTEVVVSERVRASRLKGNAIQTSRRHRRQYYYYYYTNTPVQRRVQYDRFPVVDCHQLFRGTIFTKSDTILPLPNKKQRLTLPACPLRISPKVGHSSQFSHFITFDLCTLIWLYRRDCAYRQK